MSVFHNAYLDRLTDSKVAIAVAEALHKRALELTGAGILPEYYIGREIYEAGEEKKLPNGETYREISRYSDGFGASLFISGDKMLYLTSDHEMSPLEAIDGDRDIYLTPLVMGLPRTWDFVVDFLQTQERFEYNPPCGIFWFEDGVWHITDKYEDIKAAPRGSALNEYADSVDLVSGVELAILFEHEGLDSPSEALIEDHFSEWI